MTAEPPLINDKAFNRLWTIPQLPIFRTLKNKKKRNVLLEVIKYDKAQDRSILSYLKILILFFSK